MPSRIVYMNGQYVPESAAQVSIYDLSVMQGVAAFEMTRSFRGVHFKLPEHLARLRCSCELLGIPVPADFAQLPEICAEVTDRNRPAFAPDDEHRLLIVVSPGCAPMYRGFAGAVGEPWLYVADFPLRHTVKGLGRQFREGGTAMLSTVEQVPNACLPAQAKHRSRLHFHLAQAEVAAQGADWAIMQVRGDAPDAAPEVAECPGANLFAVMDGMLRTPSGACLGGISRAYVIQLAKQAGLPVRERGCQAFGNDELFVTGTPFCLLPIVRVNGEPVGDGTPGPIYRRLLAAWSESVGVDIAAQIQRWEAA